jgi:hemerythrin superfamily protein
MNMISNLLGGRQDVVAILEADHREVEQLFEQIQRAEGSQRTKLVEKLASELTLHMSIEESLVYPRLARIDKEMSAEAEAEHTLARKVLKDLQRLAPGSPGFDGALGMVKSGIEHHVHEEEGEAFPKLRSQLGRPEMEELTEQVRTAKERGRAPRRSSSSSGSRARSTSRSSRSSTRPAASRRSTGSRATSRTTSAAKKSTKSASKRSGSSSEVTKAELVRRAKRRGITGYSTMTKAELARALR